MDYSYIKRNFDEVSAVRDELAAKLGLPPARLVCVTKSGTDEEVLALAAAGATEMAENRPQMLKARDELLKAHGYSVIMHEIGNLQTNKIKTVLDHAALTHSVGSLPLAEEIEKQAAKRGITVPVLMEINIGEEIAKGGVLPDDAFSVFEKMKALGHLSFKGIMTMAPASENPEDARPYFRKTKEIFDHLASAGGFDTETPILSMGMSDTYKVALEEGSTLIRVGRRLFINQ